MTKIITKFLLTIAAPCLTSTNIQAAELNPALERAVREKAAEVLIDPYSAVFTYDIVNEFEGGMAGKICGTVNAKNGFGAFTGRRFFFAGYVKVDGAYMIVAFDPLDISIGQAIAHGGICS
jgi:hypothetical protein